MENLLIIKEGYKQDGRFDIKEFYPAKKHVIKNNWFRILLKRIRSKISGNKVLLLEGLGKELWHGTEAQKYINKLREEWEGK